MKRMIRFILVAGLILILLIGDLRVIGASFTDGENSIDNVLQTWLPNMWVQTTQADFAAGVLNDVDITTNPDDVCLQITPSVIAYDDFESGDWSGGSGWLWGWWNSGDVSVETSGIPYDGTYHLRLGSANGYVDRAVDLTGETGVRLQFWAKADSFESGETAECLVSSNGSNWTTVENWVDGEDDNTYHFYDIDLSGFTMSSQFYIAFDAEMSGTDDYLYIDDIALVTTGSQYYSSGIIASQVFNSGTANTSWDGLVWNETLPENTDIAFEVRASNTAFTKDAALPLWTAVGSTSPVITGLPSGRYMQWRATLTTSDPVQTPILHEVIVVYNTSGFSIWIQTSQVDFEAGVLNNVDTTVSSGDVTLGVQSVPTTIASDDFESGGWNGGVGWLWGWWNSGDASIVTNGSPHGGGHHLRLRRASGYVDRAVDLTGQTDVRLQFWAKANSFEPGETAECLVSSNGFDWTIVETWVDGEDDDIYRFYDIDLSGFTMSSQFYIAFDAEMSGNNDYLYIDDLTIVAAGSQYYSSGTIASQVLDTGEAGTNWDELNWSETLASNTDITFEVRASDTPFIKDAVSPSWTAVGGTSPVTAGLPSGRYMQWRATLTSSDYANTPTLHEVIVCYN